MRQSIATSFEAPFLYLILGAKRALLLDTGVEGVNLRAVVDGHIDRWLQTKGLSNIELVVMHTHAHSDHTGNDSQFLDRPLTTVVGHTAREVAGFFAIADWPQETVQYDLGGRVIQILSIPGHHDSHIAIYDKQTKSLFSGDTIYPGRLYFQCGKAERFVSSIQRLKSLTEHEEIDWVLGLSLIHI